MQQNFAASLARVLRSEGGRVNDPQDPGGRTNQGITQGTFNAWLSSHGSQHRDVFTITPDEVSAIYKARYWDAVDADNLPSGLDYALFDFAVNSGPAKAAMTLQGIVGVAEDGKIGPITLAAIAKERPAFLIPKLCAMRLGFLKKLSTWPHFGAGWTNRVNQVDIDAMNMIRAD